MKQELYGIVRRGNKYSLVRQEVDGTRSRPFGEWESKDAIKADFQDFGRELQDWTKSRKASAN